MSRPDLAIIVPVYNESLTICHVIYDLIRVRQDNVYGLADLDVRIYIYDNNSMDDTVIAAQNLINDAKIGTFTQIRHCKEQGKGCVMRKAFSEIDASYYCMIDGDDTYDASIIPYMYSIASTLSDCGQESIMVIGDRLSTTYYTENKRPFHGFGNKLVRSILKNMYGIDFRDALTGLRLFDKAFIDEFKCYSDGFTLETEMCIFTAKSGAVFRSINVNYKDRPVGSESKVKTIQDGIKILKSIKEFDWRYYD